MKRLFLLLCVSLNTMYSFAMQTEGGGLEKDSVVFTKKEIKYYEKLLKDVQTYPDVKNCKNIEEFWEYILNGNKDLQEYQKLFSGAKKENKFASRI